MIKTAMIKGVINSIKQNYEGSSLYMCLEPSAEYCFYDKDIMEENEKIYFVYEKYYKKLEKIEKNQLEIKVPQKLEMPVVKAFIEQKTIIAHLKKIKDTNRYLLIELSLG